MKIKQFCKRVGAFFNRYINGARGAVSLLLALVVSPLLSTALLLVESARYQNVVELMEEIMDSSAFSTLAEYDTYLDERFGLLSVSQGTDINATFADYLTTNANAIGSSVSLNSYSASGQYALSNTDVLKQQLLEYSEITVAAEVVTEGFDIDKLLEDLIDALDLKELQDEIDAVTSGAELASEIEKLIEAIIDAKKQYTDKYKPALTAYRNAYTTFEEKALELIEALEAAEADLEEGDDPESIYDDGDVKDAIKALKKARDTYKNAASTLKSELSTLKGYIDSMISAVNKLPEKLSKFEQDTSESSLAADCTTSTYEWLLIISDQITTTLNNTIGDDYKDKIDAEVRALQNQITKLGNLGDKTIASDWDEEKIEEEYGVVSIRTIPNSFATMLDTLITKLDEEAAVDSEAEAQMSDLLDIVGQLLGVSGLYDGNLNAVVGTGYLHANTSMSLSASMSIMSLTNLINACETFTDGITSLNIIKAVKALGTLLVAIAEFLASIVAWVGETLFNLYTFVTSGPEEWYNSLLLYGYGAYNLPNRTNYNSGKTVTGYSYNKVYALAGGTNGSANISGSLKQLSTIGNTSGSDRMFKGAEAEYILVGSTSELQNQSVAFFDLYLFRLVLDLFPVLKNNEVSAIAALAGPGAWVVKLAITLAEPMLDCIILVNGGKSFLFKKTVYLSYSGFVILQKDLVGITSISKNLQDKIKDTIKKYNGEPKEDGTCDATYTEHMLLLMMLSVSQQTFIQRLQNLIQMETAVKNQSDYAFDLDKAYTYIYSDVEYTLNPMLNLDSLTSNGLFTASSQQYTGY